MSACLDGFKKRWKFKEEGMERVIRSLIGVVFAAGVLFAPATLLAATDKTKADDQAAAVAVENELSLTQEQKDKLKSLRDNLNTKQNTLREDLRVAKVALQKELDSANPDRKKADNLVAAINKSQTQMLALRVDQVFSMRAILTPEQYGKLIQQREKRRQEMKVKVQQGKPAKSSDKAKPVTKKGKN
jgi:Spy/CpxP family protein refolding chaperone